MKRGIMLAGAAAAVAISCGAAQAHIVEDIFTGMYGPGNEEGPLQPAVLAPAADPYGSFKIVLEYDDSRGTPSSGTLADGSMYQAIAGDNLVDPTTYASITLNGVTTVEDVTGSMSNYFVKTTPNSSGELQSQVDTANGDGVYIDAYSTKLTSPSLDYAFYDADPTTAVGDFAVGDTGGELFLSSVQVLVDPTVSGAPEPSTWSLMIAGVGLLGAILRRRCRVQIA